MQKLKPLADRVVVQPEVANDRTPGGFYIPDNAKEKPKRGKVIAVGIGKLDGQGRLVPPAVKVGDVVVYSAWAGNEIKECGDVLVINESDILGTLETRED